MSEPKTTAQQPQPKTSSIGALILIILTAIAIVASLVLGGIRLFGNTGEKPNEPTGTPSVDPHDPDFKLEAWPSDQPLKDSKLLSGTLLILTEENKDEFSLDEDSLQTIVRKDANGDIQFVLSETEVKIDKETNKALLRMMSAMNGEIEFEESISVHSAYVSHRLHQGTGTTVRLQLIKDGEPKFLNQANGESPAEWLEENAWKYGFILRYPKGNAVEGKEDGVSDVYTYVGVPHAYYMTKELQLEDEDVVPTLEDYVNLIKKEGTAQKPISFEVKKSGSDDGVYNVYYVAAKDADKALLREGAEIYDVSGVGDGYIVTSYIRIGKEPVEEEASEEATTKKPSKKTAEKTTEKTTEDSTEESN